MANEPDINKNHDLPKALESNAVVQSWPFHLLSEVSYQSIFRTPLTISRVPKHQISLFSGVVSELIKLILQGKEEAWKAFFLLPTLVLALPRGGKISQTVNKFLTLFRVGEWDALLRRDITTQEELP